MNFVFIVSDTYRFDNLAAYSKIRPRLATAAREIATPHLDRFAQRCTVFERDYAGSFPTVPNRKDMFTGIMKLANTWAPLGDGDRTFIEELVKAGYVTQMFTDTPHTVKENYNFARDFDGWEWIRGQEGDRLGCTPLEIPVDEGKCRTDNKRHHFGWKQHLANVDHIGRRFEDECFCAQTMRQAGQWLERQYRRTTPFFLYIDTFDPHEPWDAPAWYEELYDPGYKGDSPRYPVYGKSSVYTKSELNHLRAMYAAEAMLVDRWIGHLLETIERMGLMETTCIVFTSDHGFMLGEHGWTGKIAPPMYEEIAHLPLLIHMPGQQRSRNVRALTQPVDLPATILDLARAKTNLPLHGVSLRAALEGKPQRTRPFAYSRGAGKGLAVYSAEWSLVYPTVTAQERDANIPQLFHLATDPLQKKDVIRSNKDQARAMWDAHARWWRFQEVEVNQDLCPKP